MDQLLQDDMLLQKKKLEDLKAWGSLPELIEMQVNIIADTEKRLAAAQASEEKALES